MFGEVLADISLYVHARLGTLHKGKFDDSELLACGRVIYTGINKVSDPRFGWHRCKLCFGQSAA